MTLAALPVCSDAVTPPHVVAQEKRKPAVKHKQCYCVAGYWLAFALVGIQMCILSGYWIFSMTLSLQEQLPSYVEIYTVNFAYDCISKNLTNHL